MPAPPFQESLEMNGPGHAADYGILLAIYTGVSAAKVARMSAPFRLPPSSGTARQTMEKSRLEAERIENIYRVIAAELRAGLHQISAAAALMEEYTVPFIARYRKEATGGLSDQDLRTMEERLAYLLKLEERKDFILDTIQGQGRLTPELEILVRKARTLVRLEDLYLPFKPKRLTKASVAREKGLEPLALLLWSRPWTKPETAALDFLGKDVPDTEAALDGASHILAEKFSEDPELLGSLRQLVWEKGVLTSRVVKAREQDGAKFTDYFEYRERLCNIPSHRFLALLRGRREGVLRLGVHLDAEGSGTIYSGAMDFPEEKISSHFDIRPSGHPADSWLMEVVHLAWKNRILPKVEKDLENQLREQAEEEAISVFGENLRDLLLAAPAGTRAALGLDPGYRTGVKIAAVDKTGKLMETAVIYPHPPRNQWEESLKVLAGLAKNCGVELVSIGNGTASRETDRLVGDLIRRNPELNLNKVVVSEAGASVYSASEYASEELPEIDVSLRGAVSIARRLQDPLAELIKIEPKSIGVGQYQHDVSQPKLDRKLGSIVEDCVNSVGVDVNTASAPLLEKVAGLGPSVASNIVMHRNIHGPFTNRKQLLKIRGMGSGTFLQSAGFLRIRGGDNPLDASAVHPEAYPVAERILKSTGRSITEIIGDRSILEKLKPLDFADETFGEPTVRDILLELYKPGRDPRPAFATATFREGVETIEDLSPGMVLEGVVTNVANFGAFVDIGVHQDGLVHISELDHSFVQDPRKILRVGEIIKVKVLDCDPSRKRISLSRKAVLPAPGNHPLKGPASNDWIS